mmetsp:Transcript_11462/g.31739  ORF Transcript_11462/g.31739 Transcript_11462/m.31739 type:complete len:91 (+) Transcript_11462:459-731(+)
MQLCSARLKAESSDAKYPHFAPPLATSCNLSIWRRKYSYSYRHSFEHALAWLHDKTENMTKLSERARTRTGVMAARSKSNLDLEHTVKRV